jgi:Tfp pilus assembly protein PilF
MAFDKTRALATAEQHLQHGDIKRAAHQLGQVCRYDPADLRTHLKLADLYQQMGRLEVSLKTFLYVADRYVEEGHLLKAITVYNKMLSIDAGLHTIHLSLARAYGQLGLVNDATSQYKEVVHILTVRERGPERLDVIRELIDLNPENVAARVRLAEDYVVAERLTDATAQFKFAANELEDKGRIGEFIRVAERLIFHDAEDMGIRLRLARQYMGRDDVHMALPHLRACFKETPTDVDVMDLLAEFFTQMGQAPKAILVLRALANIYNRNRLTRDRDAILGRLVALDPNNAEAKEWLERSANPDMPSVAEEIEFDDIGIDEIFLDEDSVEVLIEPQETLSPEGSGELPPPLPDESGSIDEMTAVEKELESQSGELVVVETVEEADESELEALVPSEEETDEMEAESSDEVEEGAEAIDLDAALDGDAVLVEADESGPQALVVPEDETDDMASEWTDEVEEVVEVMTLDAAMDDDAVLVEVEATADEEASDSEAVDVGSVSVEEPDDDLAHDDAEVPVEALVSEPSDSVDMGGEPSEPTLQSEALVAAHADAQDTEEPHDDAEESTDVLVEGPVAEDVLPPESDVTSTGSIDWFGEDADPSGLAHVDSTELDSDVLKPLPERPISGYRLAVPVIMVDADDNFDVLISEGMDVSNDVPAYGGIHRVAVPLGSDDSWALEADSWASEDEDDGLVVEILVVDGTMDDDHHEELATVPFVLGGNLDEFDFFLQNGFHAEAAAVLDEMERVHAEHPEVVRRREILDDNAVSTW